MEERILDYEHSPPRRRLGRRALRWIFLLAIFAIIFLWGPPLERWAMFLYWRHECLNYTMPSGQVVYDSAQPNQTYPPCIPDEHFEQVESGTVVRPELVIFVHEMRRPDGAERLVRLYVNPLISNSGGSYVLLFRISSTSGLNSQPVWGSDLFGGTIHVKIFAGQTDAGNPSHFTFDYELDGLRHTCDVWLDNSDQLVISPWPATMP